MRRLGGTRRARRAHRSPGRLTADRGEHAIVTLYWLASGYGLRASRALLALAVTTVVFAACLHEWGFGSDKSFLTSLTFAVQSTTNLFRAPQLHLTAGDQWLEVGLRLLGPLCFALALLSLRGRVKR